MPWTQQGTLQAPSGPSFSAGNPRVALRRWREALAAVRANNPTGTYGVPAALALVIGASIEEGYYVAPIGMRYTDVVQRALAQRHAPVPGAGVRYVPMVSALGPGASWPGGVDPWTFTGAGWLYYYQDTFGGSVTCAMPPNVVNASASGTFIGSQFAVAYTTSPYSVANSVTVYIDGVSQGTLNPYAAVSTAGNLWTSTDVGFGLHTVELRQTIAGQSIFEGLYVYDRPALPHVSIVNWGHAGAGGGNFASPSTSWDAGIPALNPDLIIIDLGVNDFNTGRTSAQYEADLTAIVNRIEAKLTAAAVGRTRQRPGYLFVNWTTFLGATGNVEPWANFGAALRRVATAVPGGRGCVLELEPRLGTMGTSDADAFQRTIFADGIHPGSSTTPNYMGSMVLAEWLLEAIDPGGEPIAITKPIGPGEQLLIPGEGAYTRGSALNWPLNVGPTGSSLSSAGAAPAEERYPVFLRAGTYRLGAMVGIGLNSGIVSMLLDGVSAGTFDSYNAAYSTSRVLFANTMTVTADGWHVLTFRKNGTKNASASDYYGYYQDLRIVRLT